MRDAQAVVSEQLPLGLVQHAAVCEPAVVLVPAHVPVDGTQDMDASPGDICMSKLRLAILSATVRLYGVQAALKPDSSPTWRHRQPLEF